MKIYTLLSSISNNGESVSVHATPESLVAAIIQSVSLSEHPEFSDRITTLAFDSPEWFEAFDEWRTLTGELEGDWYTWEAHDLDLPLALPPGLKVFGKPSATIDYPQCVAPDKFYMAAPCISTVHVSETDMMLIEVMPDSAMHLGRDSGPVVYWAPDESDDDLNDRFCNEESPYRLSPEFLALVKSFRDLGYNYLRLDSDGDEIPGLPVFEW